MYLDFLKNIFKNNPDKIAFIFQDRNYSYEWLSEKINEYKTDLKSRGINPGDSVALQSRPFPNSLALFLAILDNNNIAIPIAIDSKSKKEEYISIANPDFIINYSDKNGFDYSEINSTKPALYETLNSQCHPGLVLFSSGTSGSPKAAVHDVSRLLAKYKSPRKNFRTIAFMLYDHIGGIDTLFYSLSNASTIIIPEDRNPENICRITELHSAEVVPVTPTFLKLLLLSESYKNYDLSSVKYVTYGTEPMSDWLLGRVNEIFPNAKFLQKYGTTEVGTLRSKSETNTSTWMKIGGEGYETKIEDGILYIKAKSAMLGYLNAPTPFTEDGWFVTGDRVEKKNGYYRILGRESEIINVGGEKVFPAEVENIINAMDMVADATVYGESHPIMGNIVCAIVTPNKTDFDKRSLKSQIKKYCSDKLESYKVPVKIKFTKSAHFGERYKKTRKFGE